MLKKQRHTLYLLLSFNFSLILLELAVLSIRSSLFIKEVSLPLGSVGFEIFLTACLHLLLFVLLSMLQWAAYLSLSSQWPRLKHRDGLAALIWLVSTLALFLANAVYFPLSNYSKLLNFVVPNVLNMPFLILTTSLLLLMALVMLLTWFKHNKASLLVVMMSGLAFYLGCKMFSSPHEINHSTKPNIVFIGVDSLNLNEVNATTTPHIFQFVEHATRFSHAVTPLARTYPSWVSILTGTYPMQNGARFNLMPPNLVENQQSLAWELDKHDYTSIFATDDRRFSSLDKDFGFQHIIGPKLGVNDIIIGTFNDFPISNLLINTPIGRRLYPYNYANRASYITYYPQTFSHELNRRLKQIDAAPIFLITHFTLPHWPYAFATTRPNLLMDEYQLANKQEIYRQALNAADKQVGALLRLLKKQRRLDNALIILLSDHGEVLYESGSRITNIAHYQEKEPSRFKRYLAKNTDTALDKSGGHGSDLLSPQQFSALLSVKIIKDGQQVNARKTLKANVSLLDIKPTVLEFLGLKAYNHLAGLSLLSSITDDKPLPTDRYFFMESGMLPNRSLDEKDAVALAEKYFTVNPQNGHVELKASQIKALSADKLYAVLWKHWLLALYPDKKGYLPVIVNLNNQQWSDDLSSPFAKTTPAASLLNKTKQFFDLLK